MSTERRASGPMPMYARLLRLRRLRITGMTSFLLVECAIAVGILLALSELVSWWAVPVLPVLVAAVVKVNDMVGAPGTNARHAREVSSHANGDAAPGEEYADLTDLDTDDTGVPQQRHQGTDGWHGPTIRARREVSERGRQGFELEAVAGSGGGVGGVSGSRGAGRGSVPPVRDTHEPPPALRDPHAPPPGLPGAQAPRRAQVIGAAVRRSMAQAQANAGGSSGGSVFGNSGVGSSSGRHSRRDEASARRSRFNERGFGRSA